MTRMLRQLQLHVDMDAEDHSLGSKKSPLPGYTSYTAFKGGGNSIYHGELLDGNNSTPDLILPVKTQTKTTGMAGRRISTGRTPPKPRPSLGSNRSVSPNLTRNDIKSGNSRRSLPALPNSLRPRRPTMGNMASSSSEEGVANRKAATSTITSVATDGRGNILPEEMQARIKTLQQELLQLVKDSEKRGCIRVMRRRETDCISMPGHGIIRLAPPLRTSPPKPATPEGESKAERGRWRRGVCPADNQGSVRREASKDLNQVADSAS
eukprot:1595439-Rhodomonas_salina.1